MASLDQGCRNLRWALALFEGLVSAGLRQLVLSPGSRSTPLVLAAQRRSELTLTPILDERSAAFFALGLARASGRPVALVCTSGSAPAHWLPAVIEASESGLPLILLSADRPPEQRGWGANQTIDQTRLLGAFIREFHDPGPALDDPDALKAIRALGLRAALVSQGRHPGPVHLNLPFREPLVPEPDCQPDITAIHPGQRADTAERWRARSGANQARFFAGPRRDRADLDWLLKGRGLICCGPMLATDATIAAIWQCAEMLQTPVLADPLSDLRLGPAPAHRITRYDSLLRNAAAASALKPDWVIRFGGTPVSKTLAGWLAGVPALLVEPSGRWSDPTHDLCGRIECDAVSFSELLCEAGWHESAPAPHRATWIARWAALEARIDRLVESSLAEAPWCEAQLITHLLRRLPAGDAVFCANSLPIRQLDTWSGQCTTRLRLFGQRGASGIDGTSSVLAGLNAGRAEQSQGVTGLLGDLSFRHDLSGLTLLERLDRPCIVLNNGGGRIFDYLPQRRLPDYERLWQTPSRLEVGALARAFGLPHRLVDTGPGFEQALDESLGAGLRGESAGLIEVRIDAGLSLHMHQLFWQRIRADSIIDD